MKTVSEKKLLQIFLLTQDGMAQHKLAILRTKSNLRCRAVSLAKRGTAVPLTYVPAPQLQLQLLLLLPNITRGIISPHDTQLAAQDATTKNLPCP